MTARADHVVLDTVRHRFKCNHCGASLSLVLPMEVSALVKVSQPFLDAHRDCRRPIDNSAQPTLGKPKASD